ncbi:MAG: hypothetical protein NVS9B3_00970 [Gemmatimonadaceae bacterium]
MPEAMAAGADSQSVPMRAFRWGTQFLCGRDGRLSHPKLVQWAVVLSYLLPPEGRVRARPPAVAAMVVAACFGYKAWQDGVSRASFAFQTTTRTVAIERDDADVLARRDVRHGFDPSRPRRAPRVEREGPAQRGT